NKYKRPDFHAMVESGLINAIDAELSNSQTSLQQLVGALTHLVAHDTADCGATHGAQYATAGNCCAGHAAHTRTGHGAFLTMAHIVPARASGSGYSQNHNGGRFTQ